MARHTPHTAGLAVAPWCFVQNTTVTATPATYMGTDGRQYLAMSNTGGSQTGSVVTNDEVIAFALPKK